MMQSDGGFYDVSDARGGVQRVFQKQSGPFK